jgi:hypothetical protein
MTCSRPIRLGVLTLFVLGLAATQAAAWGPAVHTYVADHTGRYWPYLNRIEMYGSTLPDMCYFAYELGDLQGDCAYVVHDAFYTEMWDGAYDLRTRALGFGYESHHEADKTAHEAGILVGRDEGYVIQKARIFSAVLAASLEVARGLPSGSIPPADVEPLAHNMVEVGTDVLVKRVDPLIGNKLLLAALLRGPFVPQQLLAVYTGDLVVETGLSPVEAAAVLSQVEGQFRMAMVAYGLALTKPEGEAIDSLAQLLAPLAPPLGVPADELIPLIRDALIGAIVLCEHDFRYELQGTTAAVRWRLWFQGVWY